MLKLEKNELLIRLAGLSARERLLAVGGLLLILGYGFYLLVYAPIAAEKNGLDQKINAQQQTYYHLKKIRAEVDLLRKNLQSNPANTPDNQSLMSVIDTSSSQLEVKEAVKRVVPEDTDKATVWVENIAFDKLIDWLALMETRHAVRISQINVNKDPKQTGFVSAKLLVSNK